MRSLLIATVAVPLTLSFSPGTAGTDQAFRDIDALMVQTASLQRSSDADTQISMAALLTGQSIVKKMAGGDIETADIHMVLNQADDGTPVLTVAMDGAEHDLVIDADMIEAAALKLASYGNVEVRDREPARITRRIFSGIDQDLAGKLRTIADNMVTAMFGNPAISRTGDRFHMAA